MQRASGWFGRVSIGKVAFAASVLLIVAGVLEFVLLPTGYEVCWGSGGWRDYTRILFDIQLAALALALISGVCSLSLRLYKPSGKIPRLILHFLLLELFIFIWIVSAVVHEGVIFGCFVSGRIEEG